MQEIKEIKHTSEFFILSSKIINTMDSFLDYNASDLWNITGDNGTSHETMEQIMRQWNIT